MKIENIFHSSTFYSLIIKINAESASSSLVRHIQTLPFRSVNIAGSYKVGEKFHSLTQNYT